MKILQVTKSFKPFWQHGGVAKASFEISKNLVEKGHDVTVYTIDGFSNTIKIEDNKLMYIDGVKTYYFKNVIRRISKNLEIISPGAIKIIKDNVATYDIIHFHDYRTSIAVVTAYYAMKYKIPFVIQAHGSLCTFFQKKELKKIFDIVFGYNILKNASSVIALTEAEVLQYKSMRINSERIKIVPNGINFSEYENLPEKGKFRKKYMLEKNEMIILYLGRINKIKGIDLLFRAYEILIEKLDRCTLVIVGPDDGFLSCLKKQSESMRNSDNVLFTGPLYGPDKLEAYVDADVYVLPSTYETFPMTVLEACACDTPVIMTDRCGIANVINDIAGFSVEYDKEQLCSAIFKILTNDKLKESFGNEGKKFVKENFEWNSIIKKLEDAYNDV